MLKLITGCFVIASILITINIILTFKDDERSILNMLVDKAIIAVKIIAVFVGFYILANIYDGMMEGCNKGIERAFE